MLTISVYSIRIDRAPQVGVVMITWLI